MEVLEQRQHLQDTLHADLVDLRSDFDHMRGAADSFIQDQDQSFTAIQRGIERLEFELGAIFVGFTDGRSSFGASSS